MTDTYDAPSAQRPSPAELHAAGRCWNCGGSGYRCCEYARDLPEPAEDLARRHAGLGGMRLPG